MIARREGAPSPTLAPEALRQQWGRQYAYIVLGLGAAYEAFAFPRAMALGFQPVDGAIALLYAGLVALFAVRAASEILVAYTLFAFGAAQATAYVGVGFIGPAALIPCALPVLAALFLGGPAPYQVHAIGLAAFAAVGFLRVRTHLLPPMDARLIDSRLYGNWVGLALALATTVGPVVWLVGSVTKTLQTSFDALDAATATHEAQVRLRMAADDALEKAVENRQGARRAEASGLLVAGVVHDLRNYLNVLQLAAGAFGGHPSASDGERDAAGRIRAICMQASEATRDLLRVTRPPEGGPRAACLVAEETNAVAGILRSSVPVDFRVTSTSALQRDIEVGLDPFALASTILALASAADVAVSLEQEVRIDVREPNAGERAACSDCVAVIDLHLGSGWKAASDLAADQLVERGGQLLLPSPDDAGRVRLLLPPARPVRGDTLDG